MLLGRLAQIRARFIVSACSPEQLHDLLDRPWLLERPDVPVGFVSSIVSASHYNHLLLLGFRSQQPGLICVTMQMTFITCGQRHGVAAGREPGFWVVRDDLLHPVAGGNKLRKLDALLPQLQADGATDIVRALIR